MVGFHVMNDEVIRRATRKRGVEVRQPLVSEVGVDGIRNSNLLVTKDDVGVIGHAIGAHIVLTLEQVDVVVVHANVCNVVGNVHKAPILPIYLAAPSYHPCQRINAPWLVTIRNDRLTATLHNPTPPICYHLADAATMGTAPDTKEVRHVRRFQS